MTSGRRKRPHPNIPWDFEDWELGVLFEPFGKVMDAKIIDEIPGFSKCMWITYETEGFAKSAFQWLDREYKRREESESTLAFSASTLE